MKTIGAILSFLLIILMITGLGIGLYKGAYYLIDTYKTLDNQLIAILLTALITVIVSIIIITNSIGTMIKRHNEYQRNNEKAHLYEQFITMTVNELINEHNSQKGSRAAAEYEDWEQKLNTDFFLLTRSRVLKYYMALQNIKKESGTSDPQFLIQFEQMLLEIRKDMGQDNVGLSGKEMLELLIIKEETIPMHKESPYYARHKSASLS